MLRRKRTPPQPPLPPLPLDEAVRCVAICPCARHQDAFVAALGAADQLCLRVMDEPAGGPQGAGAIEVATAVSPEGRSFLHAFTDPEAAHATFPDATFVSVAAQAAFRMSVANGNDGILVTASGAEDAWAAVTADGVARLLAAETPNRPQ